MTPLSLQQYLAREEALRGLDPQLARVICGISEACKTISSLVRRGALAGVEKTTLGDIEELAALKEKLAGK